MFQMTCTYGPSSVWPTFWRTSCTVEQTCDELVFVFHSRNRGCVSRVWSLTSLEKVRHLALGREEAWGHKTMFVSRIISTFHDKSSHFWNMGSCFIMFCRWMAPSTIRRAIQKEGQQDSWDVFLTALIPRRRKVEDGTMRQC